MITPSNVIEISYYLICQVCGEDVKANLHMGRIEVIPCKSCRDNSYEEGLAKGKEGEHGN